MNYYAGLAKRIVKSFFTQVVPVPVPQLQPLDARKIFYASSDEEIWKATLVWAEAKAQEREAAALKAVSETDTDESYDSDDSEVGVPIQPVLKKGKSLFGDNAEFDKKRVSFGVISVVEVKKFTKEDYVDDWSKDREHIVWEGRSAATIIQAAARGRAVRAWNAFASANKKPSKAVHFTTLDLRSIDIYDQDAWYRAAFAAPSFAAEIHHNIHH